MIVRELISLLQQMPQDHQVMMHWDGEPRTPVEAVWETKGGFVSIGWLHEPVYSDEGRTPGTASPMPGIFISVEEMPDVRIQGTPYR